MEPQQFWMLLSFVLMVAVLLRYLLKKMCMPQEDEWIYENRYYMRRLHHQLIGDRQGNIFTISDDASLNNNSHSYPDFFYLETASDDAARIRAQLEKDDKDLPSYEEVMGISNVGSSSVLPNAAELDSAVPSYSEVDPMTTARNTTTTLATTETSTISAAATVARTLGGSTENARGATEENSFTSIYLEPFEPSTSRAAAANTNTVTSNV